MKQQLEQFLQSKGYHRISASLPEITMYFKLERTFGNVIYVIEDIKGLFFTQEQYQHLKTQALNFYREGGVETIHMLTLILTKDLEKAKQLGGADAFCWTINTETRQLIQYETQVAEFYGMKEALEDFLFSYDEWDAKLREEEEPRGIKKLTDEWRSKSYVNLIVIAINIIVFLICTYTGDLLYNVGALESRQILQGGEVYRFVTALFLHAGTDHLLSNMIMLYFAGNMMEQMIGHVQYGAVYLLAGLGGSILSFLSQVVFGQYSVSVGASGAIFGLIGALLFQVIAHRGRVQQITTGRILFLIIYSLYSGFVGTNIDNAGHIGGLLTGFFVMAAFYVMEKMRRQMSRSQKNRSRV